jgi:hypothetical protein
VNVFARLFSIAILATASAAAADPEISVNNAYGLCRVFDSTGLLSEPCNVSGWHSSVDVKMDTNGAEARKICAAVAKLARNQGVVFDDGWKIRIYSPFSGDSTLAQCNL